MEAKCGFCNLFGDKLHCGNCRLFKQAEAAFTPKEIKCSLPKLIEICESGNVEEHFEVGDYKHIKLPYGGKIKLRTAQRGRRLGNDGSCGGYYRRYQHVRRLWFGNRNNFRLCLDGDHLQCHGALTCICILAENNHRRHYGSGCGNGYLQAEENCRQIGRRPVKWQKQCSK